LTTLHDLGGPNGPTGGLVQAINGNLYGTTVGLYNNYNNGTVFRITTGGIFTTLYSFDGTDGANSAAGLIQATDGNLYGTTLEGGTNGDGTVFKITPNGTLTTLHSFDGTDGEGPSLDWSKPPMGIFTEQLTPGPTAVARSSKLLSVARSLHFTAFALNLFVLTVLAPTRRLCSLRMGTYTERRRAADPGVGLAVRLAAARSSKLPSVAP
jgi:uncharacterized repeat protein (TIGR03803 family)